MWKAIIEFYHLDLDVILLHLCCNKFHILQKTCVLILNLWRMEWSGLQRLGLRQVFLLHMNAMKATPSALLWMPLGFASWVESGLEQHQPVLVRTIVHRNFNAPSLSLLPHTSIVISLLEYIDLDSRALVYKHSAAYTEICDIISCIATYSS